MAFNKDKFRKFLGRQEKEPEVKIDLSELKENVEEVIEKPIEEIKVEVVEKETPSFIDFVKEEDAIVKPLNEKEEFAKLDLSKDDLLELKKIAFVDKLQEDISISELVDLVLLAKSNKEIKSKNRDALCLREYVDVKGKITTKGKVYLEEETTKIRLREILE